MKVPSLLHFREPELLFRYGQQMQYPRDGLYLFGPSDAAKEPSQIRYGVIGTPESVRRFKVWAGNISKFVDVPPRGPRSKLIEAQHVAYPGFSEAFHSIWQTTPARSISNIEESQLYDAMRIENRYEAVKATVDIFVDKIIAEHNRYENPPNFWFVLIPEFVYKLGRPQSKVTVDQRIPGKILLKEKDAPALAVQPTLFGLDEHDAEVYKYRKDFRRQLKARLLQQRIVTQIIRETTLTPEEFVRSDGKTPLRSLEDPATVAWKLSTGAYYKNGGRPWQLADIRPGVCYVGLVYKQQPKDGDIRWACCAAQMFLSDGEGVVFRGALGPWYQPEIKQYHLDHDAAANLVETVLSEYRRLHAGNSPDELFIHAKSSFSEDEWHGFEDAANEKTNIFAVQIADAWDQLKLFRPGSYPVIRGTALPLGKRSAYLWTSGYVPRLDTYMGPDTPNPLYVSIRHGDAKLETVLSDVMALTKINFNTCLFNDRSPVTIRFADAIGDILVAAPIESEPILPFKFYI